jgi:hypothetical protein
MYPIEAYEDILAFEIGLGIDPETREPIRRGGFLRPPRSDSESAGEVIFSWKYDPVNRKIIYLGNPTNF